VKTGGLAPRRKKAFRPRTTLPGQRVAPNLIQDLEPSPPDQVWVSDITYVSTLEGWLYLAVILDLFKAKNPRGFGGQSPLIPLINTKENRESRVRFFGGSTFRPVDQVERLVGISNWRKLHGMDTFALANRFLGFSIPL
jgi:hypothetical protein